MSELSPPTSDAKQAEFEYGHGGVPLLLLLGYLTFLAFFTWYTLEFQLPDFLESGPGQRPATADAPLESSEGD